MSEREQGVTNEQWPLSRLHFWTACSERWTPGRSKSWKGDCGEQWNALLAAYVVFWVQAGWKPVFVARPLPDIALTVH